MLYSLRYDLYNYEKHQHVCRKHPKSQEKWLDARNASESRRRAVVPSLNRRTNSASTHNVYARNNILCERRAAWSRGAFDTYRNEKKRFQLSRTCACMGARTRIYENASHAWTCSAFCRARRSKGIIRGYFWSHHPNTRRFACVCEILYGRNYSGPQR